MYILVFYFLLISTIIPLFGRILGSTLVIRFSLISFFFAFLSSIFIFYEVSLLNYTCEFFLFEWFDLFSIKSSFILFFDKLSATMLFLVIFISFLVHIYASNYMENDPCKIRFFFFLSLFTLFMCIMVVSSSLLQFFFAWEGVGLSSYLLINFWFTRIEANRAAMKAIIINRFGDFGLYFAILLVFAFYKTLNFMTLNAISHNLINYNLLITFFGFSVNVHDLICFFFFIAVIGKSAQLGLHTWLPDAMEGPTPVSALLHAATMVTAGVYLLLRLSYVFAASPKILLFIAFWGALTAFFGATVGAFQNDIKKIIAYSTCSQLGYMVSACGLNNFAGSYYHLFNHAFFKALLFLGAGSIIHAIANEQDIRKYGNLLNLLPYTYICMFIGSCSLAGIPFLSGFYSKDILVNWAYSDFTFTSQYIYWLLVFSAFFTSYYSTKLIYLTFYSNSPRFVKGILPYISESDYRFKLPLFILAFFSIFSAFLFYDFFVGYGNDMLVLSVSIQKNYYFELEHLTQFRKFVPLFFVLGGFLSYLFVTFLFNKKYNYFYKKKYSLRFLIIWQQFFNKKWYFDFFYYNIAMSFLNFSYIFLFKSVDKGYLEDIFVKKPIYLFLSISKFQNFFQSSKLNQYVLYILLIFFFIILLFFIFFDFSPIYLLFVFFYVFYRFFETWWKF